MLWNPSRLDIRNIIAVVLPTMLVGVAAVVVVIVIPILYFASATVGEMVIGVIGVIG